MTTRLRRCSLVAGTLALAVFVAACGDDSSSGSSATAAPTGSATGHDKRTVAVAMEDIKFDQTTLTVNAGETIDFTFVNNGKIAHDAFIGDQAAQDDHEAEMKEMASMGGMDHSGDEAAITVQPGQTGQLSYTFDRAGTYQIGCHQPGHYAAGMRITVTVEG
ncbi:MAG: plastocyanin/azurin family copper-binding protein [Acidimicrobiales bacterium]|jgi:uncharacterized cupredoxin-like copper-binding protein